MDAGVSVTSKWLAKILYQVLQGVCYLHTTRVLHCDLKEPDDLYRLLSSDQESQHDRVTLERSTPVTT